MAQFRANQRNGEEDHETHQDHVDGKHLEPVLRMQPRISRLRELLRGSNGGTFL